METVPVSTKVSPKTKEELESIARRERCTTSSVVKMAIKHYLEDYNALHPQFRADILEALEGVRSGKVEPYARG
jgi:predicted DNA-binding protein